MERKHGKGKKKGVALIRNDFFNYADPDPTLKISEYSV
jgi:hypothetical protein